MFWKFGFHSSSPIDSLLDKSSVTLEEILDQEQVLQETKGKNEKLLNFISKPEIIKQLLNYLRQNSKYSFQTIEILSCEVEMFYTNLFKNLEILKEFWTFLDSEEILDLNASYFARSNIIFLQKRPKQVFLNSKF